MKPSSARIPGVLAACGLSLLAGGCALLSRPPALTTLQPLGEIDALHWPESLRLGRVEAVSMLRDTRVLVADGALRLQHGGLRWLDPPAVMLEEFLQRHQAGSGWKRGDARATLDLRLHDFHLRLDADGQRTASVAISGELRCDHGGGVLPLQLDAEQLVVSDAPRAVAAGFAAAAQRLLARTSLAADTAALQCDATPEGDQTLPP